MSMSKIDYWFVAGVMANARMSTPTDTWVDMLTEYINHFKADNPRFDEQKFRNACYGEHSVKVPEPFIAATSYNLHIIMGVAKGQTAPSADEFERIATAALKDKLNVPTTPYYVSSVTVTGRTEY